MPGIRITAGSDLRFPAGSITVRVTDEGQIVMDPVTPLLRTDMWPHWLAEAIEATVLARQAAAEVATAVADGHEDQIDRALGRELRSSMRAISAAAFAVDAFYASVQSRSGPHPHKEKWREHRTPRHAQVFETLRYQLKIRNPGAKEIRSRIIQLFKFRGWAVHPGSRFREPVYREDFDAGVDWHFAAFSATNAVNGVAMTAAMLDAFVQCLTRGTEEMVTFHPTARKAMDQLLDDYERSDLPSFERWPAEQQATTDTEG